MEKYTFQNFSPKTCNTLRIIKSKQGKILYLQVAGGHKMDFFFNVFVYVADWLHKENKQVMNLLLCVTNFSLATFVCLDISCGRKGLNTGRTIELYSRIQCVASSF